MYCSCHIRVCGEVRSVVARLSFVSSRAKTRRASATGGIWGGRERGRKGGGDPGRTYPRARCRRRGRSSSSSRRGRLRGGEGERGTGQSGCGRDEAASSRETRPGVGCAPRGGARPTPGRAGRARRGETHRRECPPSRVCFATQEGGIATCDGVNGEPRAEIFFSGRPSRRVRLFPLFLCAGESDLRFTPRRAWSRRGGSTRRHGRVSGAIRPDADVPASPSTIPALTLPDVH